MLVPGLEHPDLEGLTEKVFLRDSPAEGRRNPGSGGLEKPEENE